MARNTHDETLEAPMLTKYTKKPTSHSIGDKTNRATRMFSACADEVRRPLLSAGMSLVATVEETPQALESCGSESFFSQPVHA
jgi:hypothetical protein